MKFCALSYFLLPLSRRNCSNRSNRRSLSGCCFLFWPKLANIITTSLTGDIRWRFSLAQQAFLWKKLLAYEMRQ